MARRGQRPVAHDARPRKLVRAVRSPERRQHREVREMTELVGPRVEVEVEPAQRRAGGRVDDGIARHVRRPGVRRCHLLEPDPQKLAVETHDRREHVVHGEVLLDLVLRERVPAAPEPLEIIGIIPRFDPAGDAVPAGERPQPGDLGHGLPAERRLEAREQGEHPGGRLGHPRAQLVRPPVGEAEQVSQRIPHGERRVQPGHVGLAAAAVEGHVEARPRLAIGERLHEGSERALVHLDRRAVALAGELRAELRIELERIAQRDAHAGGVAGQGDAEGPLEVRVALQQPHRSGAGHRVEAGARLAPGLHVELRELPVGGGRRIAGRPEVLPRAPRQRVQPGLGGRGGLEIGDELVARDRRVAGGAVG